MTAVPATHVEQARTRNWRPLRVAVRGFGELMITVGVLLLLIVFYELVYTNFEAARAQEKIIGDLRSQWGETGSGAAAAGAAGTAGNQGQRGDGGGSGGGDTGSSEDTGGRAKVTAGDGFALMYIPRLGDDWVKPVLQGVGLDELGKGVGHFPESTRPGRVGNFAVAGHRATHGEPFAYLPDVRAGDQVFVETRDRWFTYTIKKKEIVQPDRIDVIAPVPKQPGVSPTEKRITLVTCNPRWGSETRYIVYGIQKSSMLKSEGKPAALRG